MAFACCRLDPPGQAVLLDTETSSVQVHLTWHKDRGDLDDLPACPIDGAPVELVDAAGEITWTCGHSA